MIGAWHWLPDYGFGVITKIDAREAFLPLRVVQRVFWIVFLLLVLASVIILIYSYMQAVWQQELTEARLKARKLGQYQLQEKIGEGGMGIVYKANHALLRRETALKLLLPDRADNSAIERFEQEVRLTCRLAHPNTIQVYDYGHTPDGIFYYAMEYLDGINLAQLLQRYGPQPEERVIYILIQICGSLREAHELGLIHRDIKPANIFLCDRGGVPDSVKVLDFGLVKHFEEGKETPPGSDESADQGIIGTPNFIAPEGLQNSSQIDARSDIYSLGVLGYVLLTGKHLFEGHSLDEVCHKHLTETPVPPGVRLGKPISTELEQLILRCLEKDPASRPQSVAELARLLSKCPRAGLWNTERRTEWWTAHRTATAGQRATATGTQAVPLEATVKIEFTDRTT